MQRKRIGQFSGNWRVACQTAVGKGLGRPRRGVAGRAAAARFGVRAHSAQSFAARLRVERAGDEEAAPADENETCDQEQGGQDRDDAGTGDAAEATSGHCALLSVQQRGVVQRRGNVYEGRREERHADRDMHTVPDSQQPACHSQRCHLTLQLPLPRHELLQLGGLASHSGIGPSHLAAPLPALAQLDRRGGPTP